MIADKILVCGPFLGTPPHVLDYQIKIVAGDYTSAALATTHKLAKGISVAKQIRTRHKLSAPIFIHWSMDNTLEQVSVSV